LFEFHFHLAFPPSLLNLLERSIFPYLSTLIVFRRVLLRGHYFRFREATVLSMVRALFHFFRFCSRTPVFPRFFGLIPGINRFPIERLCPSPLACPKSHFFSGLSPYSSLGVAIDPLMSDISPFPVLSSRALRQLTCAHTPPPCPPLPPLSHDLSPFRSSLRPPPS